MQQRNLYTQIEDFLADSSFQQWVQIEENQQDWKEWTFQNPKHSKSIEEVRLWLLAMKASESNSSQEDMESFVVKAYLLSCVHKHIAQLEELDSIFRKTTSIESIKYFFYFSIGNYLITDESTTAKVFHLNNLLNNLPARQKEALYLRYYQGLKVEQIADILQVNYQSVNNLLYRALVNLRKEWEVDFSLLLLLSSNFFNFFQVIKKKL